MKVVAYLRVSTDRQVEHGLGLSVQRQAIREWAKANGHRIARLCADEGVSGANGVDDRAGLTEALDLVDETTGLLTYNLDRLARTLHVQEAILGQVWAAGGRVFTVEDGEVLEDDPDDPYRRAMRLMRGVFSELERSVIAKRMRDGRRARRQQSGYSGGPVPFGWELAETGGLRPVKEQQATLKRIAKLRASGGSLRAIAATLDAEGRAPQQAATWSAEAVRRILAPQRQQLDETRRQQTN